MYSGSKKHMQEIQFQELRNIKDGWYDGDGFAYKEDDLKWLEETWHEITPVYWKMAYFCPMVEGGIHIEWPYRPCDMSLEIDLKTRIGYFHVLNLETNEDFEKDNIDLNLESGWQELIELVNKFAYKG